MSDRSEPVTFIRLLPTDNMASVRDRLLSVAKGRVALVLSPDIDLFHNGVNLPLLRRFADREQIQVGLVTVDRQMRRQAKALGLPTFDSTGTAGRSFRGWRQLSRREKVGFAPGDDRRPLRIVVKP